MHEGAYVYVRMCVGERHRRSVSIVDRMCKH